jgi:hypothetical protein
MVIVISNAYNFFPHLSVCFRRSLCLSLVTSWRNRNLKVYQTQAIIAFEQTRCTIGQLLVLTARDLVPAADSSIGTGIYRAYTVRSRGLITHRHLEQFQPATTFVAS